MRTLFRFMAYWRPYPWLLVLLGVTMILGLAAELLVPRLFALVIDRGVMARAMSAVLLYTGLLALVAGARAAVRYGQGYARERLGQEVIRGLRRDLYARLQRLSFSYYTVNATGDLMSRLTSDVMSVMEFYGFGLGETISSTLIFVSTIVVLLLVDWQLALVVFIPIPVLAFFVFRFSGVIGPAWEKFARRWASSVRRCKRTSAVCVWSSPFLRSSMRLINSAAAMWTHCRPT